MSKKPQTRRQITIIEQGGDHFPDLQALQREAEIAQMQNERAQWQARKASNVITVTPEALAFVFNTWRSELDEARKANNIEAMQNLLRRFVKRIEVDYNHITITYCFALNEQRLTAQSEEVIMIERK